MNQLTFDSRGFKLNLPDGDPLKFQFLIQNFNGLNPNYFISVRVIFMEEKLL